MLKFSVEKRAPNLIGRGAKMNWCKNIYFVNNLCPPIHFAAKAVTLALAPAPFTFSEVFK
jgi:hypothetical protein